MTELTATTPAPELTPDTVPAPEITPPTKSFIDQVCEEYEAAKKEHELAKLKLDEKKQRIIWLAEHYGYAPAHATQSMRIEGERNSALVTRSTSTTVNASAALDLDVYLASRSETAGLFPLLFARQLKYTFVEGATDAIKARGLKGRVAAKVAELFGKAIDVKTSSPSVMVNLIAAEKPARKPRGKAVA